MPVASLVSCGSAKRDDKAVAWQLYTSTLFQKSWTAGSYLGQPYVLSAEHGLVRGDERLEWYDTNLNDQTKEWRKNWARDVVHQLEPRYDEIVILGGRNYVNPIKDAVEYFDRDYVVHDPYQYTTGNGQQMAIADRVVEARSLGASIEEALSHGTEPYRGDEA